MAASVTHRLNTSAVRALLTSPQGGTARDMFRRGLRVETRAKQLLGGSGGANPKRVDTGRLRSSVTTVAFTKDGNPAVGVGTNVEYARHVHDGTGIYGPFSETIKPAAGKVMKWKSKEYGAKGGRYAGYAFAQYTVGMPPNPFLTDALPAARD